MPQHLLERQKVKTLEVRFKKRSKRWFSLVQIVPKPLKNNENLDFWENMLSRNSKCYTYERKFYVEYHSTC